MKPENILVRQDGHIMLTDFDLSLRCSSNPTILQSPSSGAMEPPRILWLNQQEPDPTHLLEPTSILLLKSSKEMVMEVLLIGGLLEGLLVKEPENRLGSQKGAVEIKQNPFFSGLNWALIRCVIPPKDLSVIPKGSWQDIVSASLKQPYLWDHCNVLKLTANMRLTVDARPEDVTKIKEFEEWILKVGDGKLGEPRWRGIYRSTGRNFN
ncbi:ATP-dependent DNA helicase PIF1-like protein [Tanacetum coccineum]